MQSSGGERLEFVCTVAATRAERKVFEALQRAFKADEGLCILRYPVYSEETSHRFEPDILILHREWGLIVIEVKGCRIHNVLGLEGHTWRMADWYEAAITPQEQAEKQMFALKDRLGESSVLCGAIRTHALVALPEVTRAEWAEKGFTFLTCNPPILHSDQLTPAALRGRLQNMIGPPGGRMPDLQWQALLSIVGFGQIIPVARIPQLAAFSLPEPRSCGLDAEQLRIGLEIPPGPQRLRGIAGSGKTLLLALKAARMHHSHPDWTVAFTFNNKSLYQAIRGHIQRFYHHITGLDPDWSRLRVLHAWGSKQQDGFYRTAAAAAGLQPRSVGWTERLTPEPAQQFALVCQEILDRGPAPEVFDAVLIDEGQDLPPAFYKLAYACLAEPKRLIWAYDEAQSLESFAVPSSEVLFGRTSDGQLKVDLTGVYPGGIHKSRVMRRCYRTPRGILMAGHALGMGLVRRGGPIQGFTTRHQWQDIGYEILEGGFESPGGKVVMTRPHGGSGHPLDSTDDCALLLQGLPDRSTELVWCANEIYRLVGVGVSPDDVLVVLLGEGPGLVSRDVLLRTLSWNLEAKGIAFHRADEKTNAGAFRKRGAVTLSGVRGPPPRVEPFVTHLPYFDVSAAAGKWGNLRASDDVATAWVPATGIGRLDSDMFVVRIQGDSMEPLIPDGCLGVFRRLRSGMTPGQIVLVVRSDEVGDAAVVVKKAVPSLAGYQLESLNPLYEPLPVREADRVIGTYVCSIPGTL